MIVALRLNKSARSKLKALVVLFKTPDRTNVVVVVLTILALLPILTSTGRGSDIMVPMAIPSFGGMLLAILTIFVVPVLYCSLAEITQKIKNLKS